MATGFSFAAGAAFAGGENGHVVGGATHSTRVAWLAGGAWHRAPDRMLPRTARLNAAVTTSVNRLWLLVSAAAFIP